MTNKQRVEFRGGDDWKSSPKPKPKLKVTKSVPVLPSGPVPRLQLRSTSRARTATLHIPARSHAHLHNEPSIDRTAQVTVMNIDTPAVPEPYLEPIVTKIKSDKQTCQISVTTRIPPPRVLSRREFNREKGGKKIVRSFSDRSPSASQHESALPRTKLLAYLVVDLRTGRPVFPEMQAETESETIDDHRGSEGLPRTRIKPILPPKSATMSATNNRRPVPLPRKRSLKKNPLTPPTATTETKDLQTEDSTKQVNERRARREPLLPPTSKQLQEAEECSLADRVRPSLPPTTDSISASQDRPHPIPRPRSFSKSPSPAPTSQLSNQHSTPTDPQKKHTPSSPTTATAPKVPREHQPTVNSKLKVKPSRPPPPNPKALQRAKENKATSLLRINTGGWPKNVGIQSLRTASMSNGHAELKPTSRSQSSGDIRFPISEKAPLLAIRSHPGTLQFSQQQSRTIEPKAHPDYEDMDSDDDDEEGSDVVEIPLPEAPSSPPPQLPPKPQLRGKPSFQKTNRALREASVTSAGSLSVSSNSSLSSITEQRFEIDDDGHVYEEIDTSVPVPPPRRNKKPKDGTLARSNTVSPRKAPSKVPLQPPPRSDPLKRRDLHSRTVPTSSLVTTAPSRIPRKDFFSLPDQEPTTGGIIGDSRKLSAGVDRPEGVWSVLEEPDVGGMDEYIDITPIPAWEQGERTEETQLDMEDDHPCESYVEMQPSAERPTIAVEPTSDPIYIEMDASSYIPPPALYYASKDLLAKRPDLKSKFRANKK